MKTVLNPRLVLSVLISFSLLFMGSCKKSDDTPGNGSGYYMKFKLNGTQVEYTGQVEGNFNKANASGYGASFAGLKEALVAGKNNMTLILGTSSENKTGITYTDYTTTVAGYEKTLVLNIVYFDEAGTSYLSWPEEFASALPSGTKIDAQLKITEASSAGLKGTFSGSLYNTDYTKVLTITEGEFYARRVN